jgi:hypothetical protein
MEIIENKKEGNYYICVYVKNGNKIVETYSVGKIILSGGKWVFVAEIGIEYNFDVIQEILIFLAEKHNFKKQMEESLIL